MHILHYLVALVFVAQASAEIISYNPGAADLSLLAVAPIDHPLENVELRSESTALALRSTDASLAGVSWTFGGNKVLHFAVFVVNAFVVTSICVFSETLSCAIAAAYAVYTTLFAKWTFSGRRSESFDVDDLGADSEMYLALPPTPEKSHIRRLSTELEPGLWHEVGHMRVGIFNHTIHYYNHGFNIHTLRAWQRNFVRNNTEGGEKRAEDDSDGTVIDYSWQSTNEQAYDDFDSSSSSTSYLHQIP
ncbi:hypothetical protein EW026_g6970 [Hermanssonia centrifuga]|uniref:Uncharacterized protein n=1 Tax=Hermanssonia centrifuga TaxID=98765 RepID=A0A4S4K9C6_9APHY|nr:hypothetical protein EW026_g6970 [Hermanssonia centrifuga]